jgi:hypothetical protein
MWAVVNNGVATEIPYNRWFRGSDGKTYNWRILYLLDEAQLAAMNIYRVVETPVPNGKLVASYTLNFTGSSVEKVDTLIDVPVPDSVTRYQFKQALLNTSKYQDAVAALNNASASQKLQWAEARTIFRNSGVVLYLKTALDLTDTQLDNFFNLASKVQD